jgi:hypothetical protein
MSGHIFLRELQYQLPELQLTVAFPDLSAITVTTTSYVSCVNAAPTAYDWRPVLTKGRSRSRSSRRSHRNLLTEEAHRSGQRSSPTTSPPTAGSKNRGAPKKSTSVTSKDMSSHHNTPLRPAKLHLSWNSISRKVGRQQARMRCVVY